MRPYYEESGITIYHGDCREVLPSLAGVSVDLVLTDPPYGVSYRSNYRTELYERIAGDDGSLDVVAVLQLALRILRPYRHLYVFGRWDLSNIRVTKTVELIWDKQRMTAGDLSLPWGIAHEPITFGVCVDCDPAKTKRGGIAARLRRGSVLSFKGVSGEASEHPTEKPLPLLRELIESSTRIGDNVLDLFMGVGTTLQAAHREDRRAIGIEIEERYCEIAANRLRQSVMQFGSRA